MEFTESAVIWHVYPAGCCQPALARVGMWDSVLLPGIRATHQHHLPLLQLFHGGHASAAAEGSNVAARNGSPETCLCCPVARAGHSSVLEGERPCCAPAFPWPAQGWHEEPPWGWVRSVGSSQAPLPGPAPCRSHREHSRGGDVSSPSARELG